MGYLNYIHICPYCKVEFRGRKERVYCSKSCRNKAICIGKKHTEEHRAKISEGCQGINSGENNHQYGKFGKDSQSYGTKRTAESKKKMSLQRIGKYNLENNPNWRGGKSFEPYPLDWTEQLKDTVRERDNNTCQICGDDGKQVHHIDAIKENCDIDNLITLCRSCHPIVHHNMEYYVFQLYRKVA